MIKPDVVYVVFYNKMYMTSFNFMWLPSFGHYQIWFLRYILPYNTIKSKAECILLLYTSGNIQVCTPYILLEVLANKKLPNCVVDFDIWQICGLVLSSPVSMLQCCQIFYL